MFDQISILQQIGLSVLLAAAVLWAMGLLRVLRRGRRDRFEARTRQRPPATRPLRDTRPLGAIPRQRPRPTETVHLTPAEQDAFAGLVRQLKDV